MSRALWGLGRRMEREVLTRAQSGQAGGAVWMQSRARLCRRGSGEALPFPLGFGAAIEVTLLFLSNSGRSLLIC